MHAIAKKDQLVKCETSAHHLWQRKTQDPEKQKRTSQTELCEHLYVNAIVQLGQCHKRTWVMGKAPALSSGSACKIDRKVSVPSNPSPARNACITGMTESSRSSHWTRPSRYVSRKRLHWGNPKPFKKEKKWIVIIQQRCTDSKVTIKAFIMLQKILIFLFI